MSDPEKAAEVIARARYAREHWQGDKAPGWDNESTSGREGMIRGALADLNALTAAGYTVETDTVVLLRVIDQQAAEVERLQRDLRWRDMQIADRESRDGECVCDHNPSTTNGPEENCPYHGRAYGYWVDGVAHLAADNERLRATVERVRDVVEQHATRGIGQRILDALVVPDE